MGSQTRTSFSSGRGVSLRRRRGLALVQCPPSPRLAWYSTSSVRPSGSCSTECSFLVRPFRAANRERPCGYSTFLFSTPFLVLQRALLRVGGGARAQRVSRYCAGKLTFSGEACLLNLDYLKGVNAFSKGGFRGAVLRAARTCRVSCEGGAPVPVRISCGLCMKSGAKKGYEPWARR